MAKRDKLWRKLRNNPNNATMQDLETLLVRFGFVLDRVSGSHHLYVYRSGSTYHSISIPLHGRKVKKIYVEQVLEILDQLSQDEDNEDDEES